MTLDAVNPLADTAMELASPGIAGSVAAGIGGLGLGPLVDADPALELAQLQALHVRQLFSERSLALAEQAPQTLLSLFK